MRTAVDQQEPRGRAPLRVALCQIRSGPDPEANLALVLAGITAAAAAGARIVVFPEASLSNFTVRPAKTAQPLDGPFCSAVRQAAVSAGIVAVVGVFEPGPPGRTYNTLLITGVQADGAPVESRYRKIHLFDAFGSRESDTIAPGEELVTQEIDGVTVGFATCYDLRFGAQFTELGRRGAQVVVLAASWGQGPGKDEQWELLARARAMDSQAWLLACDQAWQEPHRSAPLGIGRSLIADPLGVLRHHLDAHPGMLVADLDLDLVTATRRLLPVLSAHPDRHPAPLD